MVDLNRDQPGAAPAAPPKGVRPMTLQQWVEIEIEKALEPLAAELRALAFIVQKQGERINRLQLAGRENLPYLDAAGRPISDSVVTGALQMVDGIIAERAPDLSNIEVETYSPDLDAGARYASEPPKGLHMFAGAPGQLCEYIIDSGAECAKPAAADCHGHDGQSAQPIALY